MIKVRLLLSDPMDPAIISGEAMKKLILIKSCHNATALANSNYWLTRGCNYARDLLIHSTLYITRVARNDNYKKSVFIVAPGNFYYNK